MTNPAEPADRAIQYAGQIAGIAVEGLLETFDLDTSPLRRPIVWLADVGDGDV